jgi:hypothetical protein
MGAWGSGTFENDTAEDWMDLLIASDGPEPIHDAFSEWDADESDSCCIALAAAEVIAAAAGRPADDLPDEIREWLDEHDFQPEETLITQARDITAATLKESELAELCAESEDDDWSRVIQGLIDRLEKSLKSGKNKKSAPKKASSSKEQQKTIKELKNHGCGIEYGEGKQVCRIDSFGALTASELPLLLEFSDTLTHLLLQNAELTDDDVEPLGSLTQLVFLNLSDNEELTDACLPKLLPLTELKDLRLNYMEITDDGLSVIAQFSQLENLELMGNAITDEGLKSLYGLQNLQQIFLRGTQVTEEGAKALDEALNGVSYYIDLD